MNIEDLLSYIANAGWLLNNLFQIDTDLWQANLRKSGLVTAYGRGRTAYEALNSAIDHMSETSPEIAQIEAHTLETVANLRSILGQPAFNRKGF